MLLVLQCKIDDNGVLGWSKFPGSRDCGYVAVEGERRFNAACGLTASASWRLGDARAIRLPWLGRCLRNFVYHSLTVAARKKPGRGERQCQPCIALPGVGSDAPFQFGEAPWTLRFHSEKRAMDILGTEMGRPADFSSLWRSGVPPSGTTGNYRQHDNSRNNPVTLPL